MRCKPGINDYIARIAFQSMFGRPYSFARIYHMNMACLT